MCLHRYSVIDTHCGESICVKCGLVLQERIIYEIHYPEEYSKSFMDTRDVTNSDFSTSILNGVTDDFKIDKVNTIVMNISCSMISNWKNLLTNNNLLLSSDVVEMVIVLLTNILKTGEYQNIVGTNRRGMIAACTYIASKKKKEECSLIALYSAFDIKPMHFHHGRRFLYQWNHNNNGICDWFFS